MPIAVRPCVTKGKPRAARKRTRASSGSMRAKNDTVCRTVLDEIDHRFQRIGGNVVQDHDELIGRLRQMLGDAVRSAAN